MTETSIASTVSRDKKIMSEFSQSHSGFDFIKLVTNHLCEIVETIDNQSTKPSIEVPGDWYKMGFADISNSVTMERDVDTDSALRATINAAFAYIDSYYEPQTLSALHRKIYVVSHAPFYSEIKILLNNIKAQAVRAMNDFDDPEQKSEASLIVCMCDYYMQPSNWASGFTFWEYAKAWTDAEIHPHLSLLLNQYWNFAMQQSEFSLPKGKSFLEQ